MEWSSEWEQVKEKNRQLNRSWLLLAGFTQQYTLPVHEWDETFREWPFPYQELMKHYGSSLRYMKLWNKNVIGNPLVLKNESVLAQELTDAYAGILTDRADFDRVLEELKVVHETNAQEEVTLYEGSLLGGGEVLGGRDKLASWVIGSVDSILVAVDEIQAIFTPESSRFNTL